MYDETKVESKRINRNETNMPIFNIKLPCIPNFCLVKINNRKYQALLDSGAEVSLIHTQAHNSLKEKPKLNKTGAVLQSVKERNSTCTWVCLVKL